MVGEHKGPTHLAYPTEGLGRCRLRCIPGSRLESRNLPKDR